MEITIAALKAISEDLYAVSSLFAVCEVVAQTYVSDRGIFSGEAKSEITFCIFKRNCYIV